MALAPLDRKHAEKIDRSSSCYPKEQSTMRIASSNIVTEARTAVRVLIAILLPQLAFGLSYAWISLTPYVEQQSHWSPLITGAIYALPLLSAAVTLLWSAVLTARIAPRSLCWLGMGVFFLGLAVVLVWPSEASFIIFYATIALGVGYGMNFSGDLVVVARIFPRHIGAVSGMLTAAYALSAIAIVPATSALISGHTWLDALRIVGVSVTLPALVALLFLPSLPLPPPPAEKKSVFKLLRNPRLSAVVLVAVLVAPLGTYATSEVGVYTQSLHLLPALAASAVVMVACGTVVGRLCGGILSDHFGADRVLLAVVALDAVAGIVLWRAETPALLLLAATVMGMTCGGLIGAVPRLAMDNEPCYYSAATGMLFASFSLGGFLGPNIGGALGTTAAWLVLAGLAVSGFVVLIIHYTWIARRIIVCSCVDMMAKARQKSWYSVARRTYQRTFGRLLARLVHGNTAPSPLRSDQHVPEPDKEGHRVQHTANKTEDSPIQTRT
jgi:MFS family permease